MPHLLLAELQPNGIDSLRADSLRGVARVAPEIGHVIAAAFGSLFVVEPKLVALFFLLSVADIAAAAFCAEGRLLKTGRGKSAVVAVWRLLQNLIVALVFIWISNGFEFFAFLGTWVIAYVCLRVARYIVNNVTPAESDLRAIWLRFWEIFYVKNADVIEQGVGQSMRASFQKSHGLPDAGHVDDGLTYPAAGVSLSVESGSGLPAASPYTTGEVLPTDEGTAPFTPPGS